jgi:hypothetical protein
MPAHAGIHGFAAHEDKAWIPACAGMTGIMRRCVNLSVGWYEAADRVQLATVRKKQRCEVGNGVASA